MWETLRPASGTETFPIRAAPPGTNDCAANEKRNTQRKFAGSMNERLHLFSARHVSCLSCPRRTTHCLSPPTKISVRSSKNAPPAFCLAAFLHSLFSTPGAIFLCARRVFASKVFAAKYSHFPCDTRAKSAEYRIDFNPLVFGLLPRVLCGRSRQFREVPHRLPVERREPIFAVAPTVLAVPSSHQPRAGR